MRSSKGQVKWFHFVLPLPADTTGLEDGPKGGCTAESSTSVNNYILDCFIVNYTLPETHLAE